MEQTREGSCAYDANRRFPASAMKLVLLGDTSVGKSCIVHRLVRDEFYEFQEPTIGSAFITQIIQTENATIKFEIWDTAGQERYRSLAPMYYRGARVAIVTFDITNKSSFSGAKTWVAELQSRRLPDIIIALVGNKADLEKSRQVSRIDAETYANEHGILFYETSAKASTGVREMFVDIAVRIPVPETRDNPILNYKIVEQPKSKSGYCC